jgi:hypothetical protein
MFLFVFWNNKARMWYADEHCSLWTLPLYYGTSNILKNSVLQPVNVRKKRSSHIFLRNTARCSQTLFAFVCNRLYMTEYCLIAARKWTAVQSYTGIRRISTVCACATVYYIFLSLSLLYQRGNWFLHSLVSLRVILIYHAADIEILFHVHTSSFSYFIVRAVSIRLFNRCSAKVQISLLYLILWMCSLYPVERVIPVCPMYGLQQSEQVD